MVHLDTIKYIEMEIRSTIPNRPADGESMTTLNMRSVKDIGVYLADKYPVDSENMEKIIKILQTDGPGNAFLIGILKIEFPKLTMNDLKVWKQDMLGAYLIALQDDKRTKLLDEGQLRR